MFIIINVLNKHTMPKGTTGEYIGRGSPLGNPFPIGYMDYTREDVLSMYKTWLYNQIKAENKIVIDELNRLASIVIDERKPLNLICFCHPQGCHGDLIKEILTIAIRQHQQRLHEQA